MSDTSAPSTPLGIGSLISRSFGVFFGRFLLFFGIAFVPSLVINILSFVFIGDSIQAQSSGGFASPGDMFGPGYFIFILLSVLATFLIVGVTTLAAYDSATGGQVNVGAYVSRTLAAILPIIVLGIAYYLMMMVGLLLFIIPGLYLMARFFVFTPAILVENAKFSGLSRASELSKGYRWPIVGGLIVFGIIMILVSMASQLFLFLISAGIGGVAIYVLIQSALSAVMYGLSAAFSALLYARLREIKEGLGMSDLVKVFD